MGRDSLRVLRDAGATPAALAEEIVALEADLPEAEQTAARAEEAFVELVAEREGGAIRRRKLLGRRAQLTRRRACGSWACGICWADSRRGFLKLPSGRSRTN